MTEAKKGTSLIRLVVTLCLISAITAGLLGLVNGITKDKIAELAEQTAQAAMQEVLAADSYEEIEAPEGIKAIYKAGDAGYVVNVITAGSQGNIELMVGVDNAQVVTGVSVINHAETAGLGAKATEAEWRAQFAGLTAPVAVDKDGGAVQSITASTITSRAVCNGVNAALAAVAAL